MPLKHFSKSWSLWLSALRFIFQPWDWSIHSSFQPLDLPSPAFTPQPWDFLQLAHIDFSSSLNSISTNCSIYGYCAALHMLCLGVANLIVFVWGGWLICHVSTLVFARTKIITHSLMHLSTVCPTYPGWGRGGAFDHVIKSLSCILVKSPTSTVV